MVVKEPRRVSQAMTSVWLAGIYAPPLPSTRSCAISQLGNHLLKPTNEVPNTTGFPFYAFMFGRFAGATRNTRATRNSVSHDDLKCLSRKSGSRCLAFIHATLSTDADLDFTAPISTTTQNSSINNVDRLFRIATRSIVASSACAKQSPCCSSTRRVASR